VTLAFPPPPPPLICCSLGTTNSMLLLGDFLSETTTGLRLADAGFAVIDTVEADILK
jgi:hypothetical protein